MIRSGELKSPQKGQVPVHLGLTTAFNYPFLGTTDFVSNKIDVETGSIQVRAQFDNQDQQLIAGLFARVRVPISPPYKALLVVDSAIGVQQGQRYVLVVDENNKVVYRPVDVGQVQEGLRQVKQYRAVPDPTLDDPEKVDKVLALSPTDRVIVRGFQRYKSGDIVVPRQVNMLTLVESSDDSTTPPRPGKAAGTETPAKSETAAPSPST